MRRGQKCVERNRVGFVFEAKRHLSANFLETQTSIRFREGPIFGRSGKINLIMVSLEETISMPLVVTEHGTIRIKGSRVSLDSIIHHFKLGATAEQIVQNFPSLSLGDVYSSIAYYLTRRQQIEEYLQQQETEADALQEQLESKPVYQAEIAELRSRILGRRSAGQENGGTTPPR